MKFIQGGNTNKPVIFLLPGTCCMENNFSGVVQGLQKYFQTVIVTYDGFSDGETSEFHSMNEECEKIEKEIQDHYNGEIECAYGCSLGGSFVSLLIQRKNIHIKHGIIGSSDMDEANPLLAKIEASIITPILYKLIHTGALPKFMKKRLDQKTPEEKVSLEKMLKMFGIGSGGIPWITKASIYNQFYSDLVTKVEDDIDVEKTTIHVFYALKMGKKYRKRYLKHFKNPDIIEFDLGHEELLSSYPDKWVEEVKKCCGE